MLRTVEAVVGEDGRVRLLENIELPRNGRVLITILEDNVVEEATLLGQASLSEDWNREEEDAAWKHLQPEK